MTTTQHNTTLGLYYVNNYKTLQENCNNYMKFYKHHCNIDDDYNIISSPVGHFAQLVIDNNADNFTIVQLKCALYNLREYSQNKKMHENINFFANKVLNSIRLMFMTQKEYNEEE